MVRRFVLAALAVVLAVVCAIFTPPLGPSSAQETPSPVWTINTVPWAPLGNPVQALSCPDPSHCWASSTQGAFYATTDGGTTWTKQFNDPDAGAFWSLDCPTATNCVSVSPGGTVVWTNDGGVVWNTSSADLAGAASLSCPSASVCYAGGATRGVAVSTDGGQTWSQLTPSAIVQEINCPTIAICYGVSEYGFTRTTDGGATWQSSPLPYPYLSQITCPSASTCIALSNYVDNVFLTNDGGATWTQESSPTGSYIEYGGMEGGMSCPSSTVCYISALSDTDPSTALLLESMDAGQSWSEVSAPANDIFGYVSCPTVLACYVMGQDDGGVTGLLTDVGPVSQVMASLSSQVVGASSELETTFTTSPIGALEPGDTISLQASPGTVFPSEPANYSLSDGTGGSDTVGSITVGSFASNQVTITLSQSAVTSDDNVSVSVDGVVNPTEATSAWSLSVATSADPVPSSSRSLSLIPGPVALAQSIVQALPDVAPPDGSTPVTVYVALRDSFGNSIEGKTVTATQGDTSASIQPLQSVTSASGDASFTLTDATSELVDVTVTDTTDALVIGQVPVLFATAVPTSLTLASSVDPSIANQPVTFTASVAPVPNGGAVSFSANDEFISGCLYVPVDSSGNAQCTTSDLPVTGTAASGELGDEQPSPDTIRAEFTDVPPVGNEYFASSTATFDQFVDAVAPAITQQPTSVLAADGQGVTFTATASGAPPPSVQWQVSSDGGVTYSDIPQADATTYTTVATDSDDNDEYQAVFANAAGSVVSDAASLTVQAEAPLITSSPPPSITAGMSFSFPIAALGFPTPVLSESGALPTGVTFTDAGDGTGSLTGTPDAGTAGSYSLTITAANGSGPPATETFTLTVEAFAVTTTSLPDGVVSSQYSEQLTSNGGPVEDWWKIKGSLPSGVRLQDDGLLAGTPRRRDASRTFSFTVRVVCTSDGRHFTTTRALSLSILSASTG